MLMLFKIAMTISIVWFVASLVGLAFNLNGKRPKLPHGPRRFFDSSASWLHVGRWAMGALTYFIFLVEGLYHR